MWDSCRLFGESDEYVLLERSSLVGGQELRRWKRVLDVLGMTRIKWESWDLTQMDKEPPLEGPGDSQEPDSRKTQVFQDSK